MLPKNIPLYTLDLTGKNPNNLITQEYYQRKDLERELIFVLRSGPFYSESLSLYKPDGTVLVEEEDYEIVGIASTLTAFVKDKEISMMVTIKNPNVTEFFADYQIVGHFSVLNKDLVDLVNSALEDERPVKWKNIKDIPKWFVPELHQHDLRYEIHSFQDLINCIKQIKDIKNIFPQREVVSINQFYSVILSRIEEYEKRLLAIVEKHDSDYPEPYTNSHGLTAKQVELEKVDNFETATLLDILDGFRRDLHVTADYAAAALKTYAKESDNLIKSGSIPILRYGSNSFIPTPVTGSFEGMGGDDFYIGINVESNGDGLILMPRNDGKVRGLYFMNNTDIQSGYPMDKWSFTAYQYTHQTPESDGVVLTKILRGSDGKFLILGGQDSSGKTVWYWTLGNGTFDPLKHKLEKLPSDMQGITIHAFLCTTAFPTKIFLFDVLTDTVIYNDLSVRDVGFEYPGNDLSQVMNKGVTFHNNFLGLRCWEFEISSKTWRQVVFNYKQATDGKAIQSYAWVPWRQVIKEVTPENPRSDGLDYPYGLAQSQFVFSKLITMWVMRFWWNQGLDQYDKENDRLGFKYTSSNYGSDQRQTNFEMGTCSFGAFIQNRNLLNNVLYYDIENKKALTDLCYFDTTTAGADGRRPGILSGNKLDHVEYSGYGGSGYGTISWFNKSKIFYAVSASYGTFPVRLGTVELAGTPAYENIDKFVTNRYDEEATYLPTSGFNYNETNTQGLTIGAHSTYWVQLDPNKSNTMGSVSFGSSRTNIQNSVMTWRNQPALDDAGFPIEPNTVYNLYPESIGSNKQTYGYDLINKTKIVTNHFGEIYCNNIFINIANNRKSEYWKNHIAHHAFKTGETSVSNSTANTDFDAEFSISYTDVNKVDVIDTITFTATKTYDLKNQITNILIPKLESYLKTLSNASDIFTGNMLQTHRIMFTNLPSAKYDKFLIFSASYIDKNTGMLSTAAVAFNLTGGKADSSGKITDATVTPVGDVKTIDHVLLSVVYLNDYINPDIVSIRPFSQSYTLSRDLVQQVEAGKSFIVAQMSHTYNVKGNRYEPGVKFIVTENGITEIAEGSVYYTSSTYRFFLHPYYGACNRAISPGPSEVGYPWNKPTTVNAGQNSNNFVLGNSNYLQGAFTLFFGSDLDITLNGRNYTIKKQDIDLTTIISNPRNRQFFVYIDYNSDGPFYNISLTPLAETPNRSLIATVLTNSDSIYEINRYNTFTMNGIRVSSIKHGSSIPAATGTIEEQGQSAFWLD